MRTHQTWAGQGLIVCIWNPSVIVFASKGNGTDWMVVQWDVICHSSTRCPCIAQNIQKKTREDIQILENIWHQYVFIWHFNVILFLANTKSIQIMAKIRSTHKFLSDIWQMLHCWSLILYKDLWNRLIHLHGHIHDLEPRRRGGRCTISIKQWTSLSHIIFINHSPIHGKMP